jgi:hypothetical protein
MKKTSTPLVDDHLQSLVGMQEAATDEFFYTRLKERMQGDQPQQGWSLPLKPVWVIGTLTLLLAINGIMLSQQLKGSDRGIVQKTKTTSSSLQSFAESYDQTITSSY